MVIPQTAGALLAFLALVAPGILFELLRSRRRPGVNESVFREISRIALASLCLTFTSSTVILLARLVMPRITVDLRGWYQDGSVYVRDHFYVLLANVGAELLLACVLAACVDFLLYKRGRGLGNLFIESPWDRIFRTWKPRDSTPWVHVELLDGSSFYGYLMSATSGSSAEDRELVLESPLLAYRGPALPSGEKGELRTIGANWEFVIISSKQIKYLRVGYRTTIGGNESWSIRRIGALERDNELGADPKPTTAAAG